MKPNQQNKLTANWPDLYFNSLANKERFIDTTILTLKTHYRDVVTDHALNEMLQKTDIVDPDFYAKVEARANTLMNEGSFLVREFVKTDDNQAMVCLNVKNIDAFAVEMALDRLTSIGSLKPNMHLEFGSPMSFSANEVSEIFRKH